jgi:hypothetical protein
MESYDVASVMESVFLFDTPYVSCNLSLVQNSYTLEFYASNWWVRGGFLSLAGKKTNLWLGLKRFSLRSLILARHETPNHALLGALIGLKTILLRQFMRLKPWARDRLDGLHRIALEGLCLDHETRTVAVHIRRTDKRLEATLTPTPAYAKGVAVALQQMESARDLVIFVMSDDVRVKHEFTNAVRGSHFTEKFSSVKVSYRISAPNARPDQNQFETADTIKSSMLRLLTDLRLIATSDVFIGTQSS